MKIILYILLFTQCISLSAQNRENIEILNADSTFSNSNRHADYWRLIGNVSFKHNNAIMYCDSAYHYINTNKIQAFSKIMITQGDSITLTGNNLAYFGSEDKVDIKGNVVLIDKYMTLKTEQLYYNLISNIASYPKIGKIIDDEKEIISKRGEYHSNKYMFIFNDSVTVIAKDYKIQTDNMHYNSNSEITYFFGPSYIISDNKTIYCENGWYNTKMNTSQFRENASITTQKYILKGDSIYYNKNLGYGKVIKNIEAIDTVENLTIFGGFAEYFESNKVIEITENPLLQILFEKDTLFMHADKFISQQKSETKKVIAHNNVKFFKSDIQGKCDSLSYNFTDSIIEMFNRPVIWSNEYQITADSIKLLAHKGQISRVFFKPRPMIIAQVDSIDFNQIRGKKIIAYFTDNKIKKMNVEGSGQSIFIVTDDDTNEKIGLNYTECTNISLYFNKNKLNMVNYNVEPNSITTPYSKLEEKNRYLKGFIWRGSEQPKRKEDIFIQ